MRARNIKPGFFANEELAECSPEARLLFIGLWCMADREGRLEDRPKRISKELFGYELIDVVPLLDELEAKQFIVRYCGRSTSDQGQKPVNCIYINNFGKHQSPHRNEAESVLPSVDESTSVLGQKPSCPWPVPLTLNEDCLIADCLNEECGLSDCGMRNEESPASPETKPTPPPKPAHPEPLLPRAIDTPEMQVAWSEWLQHRKEIKKPLTATQKEKQLKKFARKGVAWSLAAIENTIEHGWIGLLHPSEQGGGNRGHPVGDARGNLALREQLLAAARANPQEAPNDPT